MKSTGEQAIDVLLLLARILSDPISGGQLCKDAVVQRATGAILRSLANILNDDQTKSQRRVGFGVDRVTEGNYRAQRSKK
jgi:hypothetical protein